MDANLSENEARSGVLVDGVEGTPYVVATLYYDSAGVHVAVPYVSDPSVGQFSTVDEWFGRFGDSAVPVNLRYQDTELHASFFGTQYRGGNSNLFEGTSVGRFSVDSTVVGRATGPIDEPLLVTEMQSRVDGLYEWTQFRAADVKPEHDQHGRVTRLEITVESTQKLSWKHGAATVELGTDWAGLESGKALFDEWVTLSTRFDSPAPVSDHIAVQASIRTLLAILFGSAIYFRRHVVASPQFQRVLPAGATDMPMNQLISSASYRDYSRPAFSYAAGSLLAQAHQLGVKGLEGWANNVAVYSRVVSPVFAAIQRQQSFVEDVILNASMSLEARGFLLPPLVGEPAYGGKGQPRSPSFKSYVARCLSRLPRLWDGIADSPDALAAALATSYNGVKHPERVRPAVFDDALLGPIALWIARLSILEMLDVDGALMKQASVNRSLNQDLSTFEVNDRFIDASGTFVSWAKAHQPGDAE